MLFAVFAANSQILERYVKATETLETGNNFVYKSVNIPVADVTYHEFSADSITWRKNYVAGDCYVRFNNYSDNSTTKHPSSGWWGLNFCNLTDTVGGIDTLFVYYHNLDTITTIDTVVTGVIDLPAPDSLTGSTINYQDASGHTHALYINLNDLQNVQATPTNGQVLKYNSISGLWQASNDLVGGGSSSLTVTEEDDSPSVDNVNEIRVANGKLTDNGVGSVSIDFTLEPILGAQEFFRTGTQRVGEGDPFIVFGTPFTAADYIVTSAFAVYDNQTRQNLVSDSLTVNGFKVLSILEDSATVTYVAMRALDSLGLAVTEQGRVMGSGSDTSLGYLNQSVDDNTITVINNELTIADNIILDTVKIDTLSVNSLVYADTYWNDMTVSLASAAPGTAAPDLEAFRGSTILARAFAGSVTNESVHVEVQFSHAIKDSSIVYPHIHYSPSTTPVSTDTVVVEFEYVWASYSDVFPTSTTITQKIPLNGKSQWGHYLNNLGSGIAAIGDQASSMLLARITRVQDNVSDTYANDLFIFTTDIHYEIDKPGSPSIIPD